MSLTIVFLRASCNHFVRGSNAVLYGVTGRILTRGWPSPRLPVTHLPSIQGVHTYTWHMRTRHFPWL